MSKSVDHLIRSVDMTVDQENKAAFMNLYFQRKLRIWDENGETVCWCDQCQRIRPIDKKTLQEVKAAQICPMCFRPIRGTTKQSRVESYLYIEVDQDEGDSTGYRLDYVFDKGEMEQLASRQVGYWPNDDAEYVRMLGLGMMGQIYTNPGKPEWRKTRTSYYYGYSYKQRYRASMFNLERYTEQAESDTERKIYEIFAGTKKEFYRWLTIAEPELKTNQIELIRSGLYNQNQIHYIRAFDLKTRAQVLKASAYMKNNWMDAIPQRWTPTTLEYLRKNKIRLADYIDYAEACKLTGRKVDRPQDFRRWHDEITRLAEDKKDAETSALITKRAGSLEGYEKKALRIYAIGSIAELAKVGQTLHNCIRTYAKRYAAGTCDLYCMTDDGEIVGAIEVRDGKIIQARADHNEDLPRNYKQVVNAWAKERSLRS